MKRKILALVLALALLSSFAVVAFANASNLTCDKCGTQFASSTEYDSHVKSCSYVQCGYCGKYFQNSEVLKAHQAVCENAPAPEPAKEFKCNDCNLVFETAADLAAHIDQVHKHPDNAIPCPYDGCSYIATSIEDYNNHIAANHGEGTVWDVIMRQFDKYVMGINLNVSTNSFTSVVRVFAYIVEVFMSVFTESGLQEVFQSAGDSGVAYFFESLVPVIFGDFVGR